MKKILIIATSLLVILSGNPANACSCLPTTPRRSYQQARTVFAGKVTDIVVRRRSLDGQSNSESEADRLFTEVKVTLEVSKVWKGRVTRQSVIMTANSSASCGYTFEKGREYLIYASGQPSELTTGLCSGTKPLSSARADLAVLGQGSAPNPESSSIERLQPNQGI